MNLREQNTEMILSFAFSWPMVVAAQSSSDDHFMGWFIQPDTTERMMADTKWTTSGTIAGECVTQPGTCVLATGCSSNTLFFPNDNGDILTCNSGYGCVAMTIYEDLSYAGPTATNYDCRVAEGWSARTLYRTLPAGATRETTIYTAASATSVTATTFSSDTAPPYSSPSLSSSPTNSPLATSNGTESKAWIAGAVVGPVAGLALCAAAYWLWMRRRKSRRGDSTTNQEANVQIEKKQPIAAESEVAGDHMASPSMLHASSVRRMSELPC